MPDNDDNTETSISLETVHAVLLGVEEHAVYTRGKMDDITDKITQHEGWIKSNAARIWAIVGFGGAALTLIFYKLFG